jgi:hypothetical protein
MPGGRPCPLSPLTRPSGDRDGPEAETSQANPKREGSSVSRTPIRRGAPIAEAGGLTQGASDEFPSRPVRGPKGIQVRMTTEEGVPHR